MKDSSTFNLLLFLCSRNKKETANRKLDRKNQTSEGSTKSSLFFINDL